MLRKVLLLAIFGLCFYGNFAVSANKESEEQADEMVKVPSIPFRTCFVKESKVTRLMSQMETVIGILNSEQDHAESRRFELDKIQQLDKYEMCMEERMQKLVEELRWVSRRIWELSTRLEEPKDAEVQLLNKRKIDLIRHLQNVQVVTEGLSPGSLMHVKFFDTQVEFLEYGFNKALKKFQATTIPMKPCHPEVTIRCILGAKKSASDLIEISFTDPEKMSRALPQLVSNWYAGTLSNFDRTLQLVRSLPTVGHRVMGYAALYEEMQKSSHLETFEVALLAGNLKEVRRSLGSTPNEATNAQSASSTVESQLQQLEIHLKPIYRLIGKDTKCNFRNVKYNTSLSYSNSTVLGSIPILFKISSFQPAARAVFEISYFGVFRLFSSDSRIFSDSKRLVTADRPESKATPAEMYTEWKLIPVQGGKYFKILNAQYDEVLFADKAEVDANGNRIVFLARNTVFGPRVYEAQEALWSLECQSNSRGLGFTD